MEEKKIVAGAAVTIDGVTLIPVVRVSLNCWRVKGGVVSFGVKHPVGVVVVSSSTSRTFRISGEEVPLAQFTQEFPDVGEIVAGYKRG